MVCHLQQAIRASKCARLKASKVTSERFILFCVCFWCPPLLSLNSFSPLLLVSHIRMAQGVRGSVSHWLHSSPTWPKPADGHPQASSNVDVLIVGGGITGCSLAYHLRHLAPTLKVSTA